MLNAVELMLWYEGRNIDFIDEYLKECSIEHGECCGCPAGNTELCYKVYSSKVIDKSRRWRKITGVNRETGN